MLNAVIELTYKLSEDELQAALIELTKRTWYLATGEDNIFETKESELESCHPSEFLSADNREVEKVTSLTSF